MSVTDNNNTVNSRHQDQLMHILPSYELHQLLNRDLDQILRDSCNVSPPPPYVPKPQRPSFNTPSYYSSDQSSYMSTRASISTDLTTQERASYMSTRASITTAQTTQEYLERGLSALNDSNRNSIRSNLNSLDYVPSLLLSTKIIINIVLYDYDLDSYNPYFAGDVIKGIVRVTNFSTTSIPYEQIFVTFEGTYTLPSGKPGKKLTHKLLEMTDFIASGLISNHDYSDDPIFKSPPFPMNKLMDPLPKDKVLMSGMTYDTPFVFELPIVTDSCEVGIPVSIGNYHFKAGRNIKTMEATYKQFEKDDFMNDSNVSVFYCVRVRLLILSPTHNQLYIGCDIRHVVEYAGLKKGDEKQFGDFNYELGPDYQILMLMKHLESVLNSIEQSNSKSSSTCDVLKDVEFKENFNTCELYNRNSKENRLVTRPTNSIILKTINNLTVEYNLNYTILGSLATSIAPHQFNSKMLINIHNGDIRYKSIKMHSITVYSKYKIPIELNSHWFINSNEFKMKIKPNFMNLKNKLMSLNDVFDSFTVNSMIDSTDQVKIQSFSDLEVQVDELPSSSYKVKDVSSHDLQKSIHQVEINMTGKKSNKSKFVILPSFKSNYICRFYFLRFKIKTPDGLSHDGEKYLDFDIPIEIN
ncbi:hypothetical protein CANARDRAFT_6574 [[Candida] arabinofermentans NRRL YB-2248]|uniref:Bul1 N-terminal domain-containing protein n=1 Tax=[Candida] arabinofermentans NRRL YB-2248 TaxID=983967 RepID=A0A1E4T5K3_9ASCO|nr:hypothetical protein CANARDRAFT_6574 [[Candida] arabinofermentans NRRL YB-2248]